MDASRPPSRSFRLNAKRVLLTYPKVPTTLGKEQVLQRLQSLKFGSASLDQCLIALEHHKDGEPHLHIATSWTAKLHLRSAQQFDSITGKPQEFKYLNLLNILGLLSTGLGKHGNYQGIKSWPATLRYLMKEDPNPLNFGITPRELERAVKASKSSQPTKTDRIATRLSGGETTIHDILK